MKTITVADRYLEFEDDFLKHYERYACVSLEKMAKGFICGEYEIKNIEEAVKGKTDKELTEVILKWANADLEGMGVPYANV